MSEASIPNDRLKMLYREVSELKASKYVGTQESWQYVSKSIDIEESPKRVASLINAAIKEQNHKIIYEATPEKILGLLLSIEDLLDAWNVALHIDTDTGFTLLNFLDEAESDADNMPDALRNVHYFEKERDRSADPILRYLDMLLFETKRIALYESETALAMRLIPLFIDVQNSKTTDKTFGYASAIKVLDSIPLHELERSTLPDIAAKYPWTKSFSTISIEKAKRDFKSSIYNEFMSTYERVSRVLNDNVDHKLEIRREILTDYVQANCPNLSYDEMLKQFQEQYKNTVNYKKYLTKIDAPEYMQEQQDKLITYKKFLLMCIIPEQAFLEKFLRS